MKLNRAGRVPPTDGVSHWRLPVGSVVIRGKGFDDLIRNVFEYRLRNHLPIGDIEAEVDSYYCSRYPGFCREERNGVGPNSRVTEQALLNRVSMWASATAKRMPRGGYPLVSQVEAERRADICAGCPKNRAWRGGCAGCSSITLQLTQAVKQLHRTSRDGNLQACEIGGYELGTSIWLPEGCLPITEGQRAAMPDACWRKAMP